MEEQKETFRYTYSAKQQEEVRHIREKYLPKTESKLDHLRRLDESVTRPGRILALTLGILGTLVLGVGMCFTMVWGETLFVPGICVGLCGILLVVLAYPLYRGVTRRRRGKLAPQIMKLTEELMQ